MSTDPQDIPHHERIEDPIFRHAVELLDAGEEAALRGYLREHPGLVHQRVVFEGQNYFRNPTLLEFVAENPIRRGRMPGNIVEVAQVILDAGAGARGSGGDPDACVFRLRRTRGSHANAVDRSALRSGG